MRLLMIDNYDSFTYNIVQYFGELGAEVTTLRNDEVTLDELDAMFQRGAFERLCISPGPCSPAEAGVSVAAIRHFAGKLPILGVCLGHQAIGAAFGGTIVRAQQLMHGKTSVITTTRQGVFAGLPERFTVNRYHSLAIRKDETTARATGSYDVVESEYATLVAEQETARDAARDLSNTIANLLALYFKRQGV